MQAVATSPLTKTRQTTSGGQRMDAIAFDLDTHTLKDTYPVPSDQNAYTDIRREWEGFGFEWQQGSVHFGGPSVDAVPRVLAV